MRKRSFFIFGKLKAGPLPAYYYLSRQLTSVPIKTNMPGAFISTGLEDPLDVHFDRTFIIVVIPCGVIRKKG